MIDNMEREAADFIAQRRDAVARAAALDLHSSTRCELPDLLHRLAGKLAIFGYEAAGDASRSLMRELDGLDDDAVRQRLQDITAHLGAGAGRMS